MNMSKMITREFINLTATVLVYDRNAKEAKTIRVMVPQKNYTERTLENAIAKAIGDGYKVIEVIDTIETRELRGMYINDFYVNSFPLDENRKKVEE